MVASLETLLSIEAADKLDPWRRITPPNRELIAQGAGNILSGLIGGLPVTSVVVRTSANIGAGARTRAAAIVHGFLLLVVAVWLPGTLNRTPLSCLAAILLVIGYRLARPALFCRIWRQGAPQFVPFVVTVVAVVFTDLLTGVSAGFAASVGFIIRSHSWDAMRMVYQEPYYVIHWQKDVSFVQKARFKQYLQAVPDHASVLIDATAARYLDPDILELAAEFYERARFRHIQVELRNLFRDGQRPEDFLLPTGH